LLPQALKAVQNIHDKDDRRSALIALADLSFPKVTPLDCWHLWKNMLHFLSDRSRPDLISDLAVLSPVINTLGGEGALSKIAQEILDVSECFP
jgi:hypothetical protein